ncbi:MAG: hypothetical protein LBH55_04380 [Mycoplasmataceae bacterium]|jgi:hypothetical protein|nr:hypothetical protein [Mycoplasmataceae bacterium]
MKAVLLNELDEQKVQTMDDNYDADDYDADDYDADDEDDEYPYEEGQYWDYNGLKVEFTELNNIARLAAENYWYDVQGFTKPESPIKVFYDNYGQSDEDETLYEDLLRVWFELYEKHKSDPLIRAKYEL